MTYDNKPVRHRFPTLIAFVMIALMWLSCDSAFVSDEGEDPSQSMPKLPDDQAILFEMSYENFAWGHYHEGWVIDRSGRMITYIYFQDDDPWQPQDPEAITEQELFDKLSHNAGWRKTVDSAELAAARQLIPASAIGRMSDTNRNCDDAGIVRYLAYVREDTALIYHPILLYQHGDIALRNRSRSARTLFDWMRTVDKDSYGLFCPPPE